MKTTEIIQQILKEIDTTLSSLNQEELDQLIDKIVEANRIFVAGSGRSLMMIRGLAMRLMHTGFTAYVVGETVTPAIESGDLLIIASGSGTTGTLTVNAEKAKDAGADLALITTNRDSTIGNKADYVVEVKAAAKDDSNENTSMQPAANTFEQSVLLIGDAIVVDLIENDRLPNNNKAVMDRHANLE